MAQDMRKRIRDILRLLDGYDGWDYRLTDAGHYRITGPGGVLVFAASTPSDPRAVRNVIGELRRRGCPIQTRR